MRGNTIIRFGDVAILIWVLSISSSLKSSISSNSTYNSWAALEFEYSRRASKEDLQIFWDLDHNFGRFLHCLTQHFSGITICSMSFCRCCLDFHLPQQNDQHWINLVISSCLLIFSYLLLSLFLCLIWRYCTVSKCMILAPYKMSTFQSFETSYCGIRQL